jgi:hypothetical protein
MLGLCEDYPEETRSLGQARVDLQVAHEAGTDVPGDRLRLGRD